MSLSATTRNSSCICCCESLPSGPGVRSGAGSSFLIDSVSVVESEFTDEGGVAGDSCCAFAGKQASTNKITRGRRVPISKPNLIGSNLSFLRCKDGADVLKITSDGKLFTPKPVLLPLPVQPQADGKFAQSHPGRNLPRRTGIRSERRYAAGRGHAPRPLRKAGRAQYVPLPPTGPRRGAWPRFRIR